MSVGRVEEQRGRVVRFAFGAVRVEDTCADTDPVDDLPGGWGFTWPCPGCDRAQPVSDARTITVSEPPYGANRRDVMICLDCARGIESAGT